MTYQLHITSEAASDLRRACEWYDEQRPGLGDDFLLCVEAAMMAIQANPMLYPVGHKEIRRVLIRRFPYAIFYIVDKQMVTILAVLHFRQDPNSWKRRKPS